MTDRSLLDGISIASPCSADWNTMQGDDRRRFCAQCKLHVYDLSAMSTADAERLLRGADQGRVCVRLFRRADGTVLTRDCPVGLRQRLRAAFVRAAALVSAMWLSACRKPPAPVAPPTGLPPVVEPLQGAIEMGERQAPAPVVPEPLLGKVAPGVRATPPAK